MCNGNPEILAEEFSRTAHSRVIDGSVIMHGGGPSCASRGLVEGILLLPGIFGRAGKLPDEKTIAICRRFAREFEKQLYSLQWNIFRREDLPRKILTNCVKT